MRKLFAILTIITAFALVLGGCNTTPPASQPEAPISDATDGNGVEPGNLIPVSIGATVVPHAEVLYSLVDTLKEAGVELNVVEFADYTLVNTALTEGQIDANYFQHIPYLTSYNENAGGDLVPVITVHIEPIGAYSNKITDVSELADGATIAIPNDDTNEGRALLLLQSQGLITLKEEAGLTATPLDIVDNPKDLKFVELDAAMLPRTLDETDLSVINTNYALEAGFNPTEDAVFIEGADSPYVNVVAVRSEDQNAPWVSILEEALHSDATRQFILSTYEGAVVPVF